ncbi:dUTP diphosphatase [Bacillus smithii]|uniref:dUTP diphosphatase n=1 Tax=Bacillus smithii TaxID=1479 RepID=UPI0030C9A96D
MNLQKLFEMQSKLDTHIEKEHPRDPGEDRLAKKILALQVELGELANEWRGFKFWSHDQEPRYELYDEDEFSLLGDLFEQEYPLLEEYVDCLHFILSIGLECGLEKYYTTFLPFASYPDDVTKQFNAVFWFANQMEHDDYYEGLVNNFLGLGEMLGFTWDQIEQAYMKKNAINHERQEQGY